jgi:ribonuclease P protein component
MKYTFSQKERITNKKTFEHIFNSGKSISVYPYKWIWIETPTTNSQPPPLQLGISVPKKSFHKAVDRNKIKRRIREAYRKNKYLLYEVLQNKKRIMALMVIYTAKDILPYCEMEKKMIVSLRLLINEFVTNITNSPRFTPLDN